MAEDQEDQKAINQEIVDSYRDLIATPAWNKFQDHLGRCLTKKEVVKAEAIRKNALHDATLLQGWIDAINFVIGEPTRIITRLTNQSGDE